MSGSRSGVDAIQRSKSTNAAGLIVVIRAILPVTETMGAENGGDPNRTFGRRTWIAQRSSS
ncbi:hypothetical protein CBM2633_P380012 [Cupriavidus taiwanensis]|uniref:Uncharacterized protein n=2 Tax=Cupriavidus TaxID=106589 RepID=A0A375DCZ9_9BURK|nr:hypothetical protein CBM2585_P380011 [Cupriavidus taiwanensis]SOZ40692.1 hypothetical protein CBM2605_P380013 [Cupriavidus neocaledonicus]SOY76612.1 hypothetical protein CBM2588_P420013 [Cupriavidus taiwanensis]SOY76666.1 hypothetical protein CBM2592_P400011 [Cupriavidus taiwanensis]SOY76968.1 hypothetical protein CBM2589_P380012 [Cupriavidus taiwanensis]